MEPYTYESENGIKLVTIKGRTYRKAPVSALKDRRRGESSAGQDGAGSKRRKGGRRAAAGFGDEEGADDVERLTEELCDAPSSAIDEEALALDIRKEGELFTYRMHVPSAFFGNIIGKGGQMRTRLQTETGATITVPKQGSTSEDIIIKAEREKAIVSAKTRIDVLVQQAKDKMDYTHFLSIPLTPIKDKVKQWQDEITQKYTPENTRGFDPSILLAPEKMHLTVLMLKLFSAQEINKAKELLKQASAQVYDLLGSRSEVVRLQGLDIMNDDPSAADVVYIKVQEVGDKRLIPVCDHLTKLFYEAGLASSPDRALKLHATLVNTRYRRTLSWGEEGGDDEGRGGQRGTQRQPFDATDMLRKYGNIDFGQHRLIGIHLSERGRFAADTGFYHCVSSINFP